MNVSMHMSKANKKEIKPPSSLAAEACANNDIGDNASSNNMFFFIIIFYVQIYVYILIFLCNSDTEK